MILKSVKLSNFMGIKRGTLNMEPGGMLITGENGSGKSTWISALNFAFFGSVPGLVLKDVLSFGERSGDVEVCFDNYILTRSFDKNSTNLKLSTITGENLGGTLSSTASEKLMEIFPVPQELFNEIVIKQQGDFGSMTEATPSARYAIFKKLADVAMWDNYFKAAKWMLAETTDAIKNAEAKKDHSQKIIKEQGLRMVRESELNAANEECERAKAEISKQSALQQKFKEYEEAQRLIAANADFDELYEEWLKVKDIPKPPMPRVAVTTPAEGDPNELRNQVSKIDTKGLNATLSLKDLELKLETIDASIALYNQGKCHTCARPFESAESELIRLDHTKKGIMDCIRVARDYLESLRSERKALINRIAGLEWSEYEKKERLTKGGSPEVLKSKLDQAASVEQVEPITSVDITKLRERIEEFSRLSEMGKSFLFHVNEIAKCDTLITELEKEAKPLEELCSIYDKNGAPKRVIMQWVKLVEKEANRQLNKFDVTFIEKSETGRETLELIIRNTQTGIPQKFKSLSGGERTRINVAFAVAMSNVYSAITGIPVQTMWFDEVYGLDEFGQQEFAELIKEVAKQKAVVCATSCFESMSLFFKAEKTFKMVGGELK